MDNIEFIYKSECDAQKKASELEGKGYDVDIIIDGGNWTVIVVGKMRRS